MSSVALAAKGLDTKGVCFVSKVCGHYLVNQGGGEGRGGEGGLAGDVVEVGEPWEGGEQGERAKEGRRTGR